MKNKNLTYSLLIGGLAALFFIPFLGGVHLFDWDEINFAEASREMLVTGDFFQVQIDFQAFWEKPPLFFWMQAAAMNIFGVGEFAARLPNAICGIATLIILFQMGNRLFSRQFGLIWAGVYASSILPFLYFKSGIIDPWFNLFMLLGLYYFILFYWKKADFKHISLPRTPTYYLWWAGTFIGLAVLTKGPVGLLIPGLVMIVYWGLERFRWYVKWYNFIILIGIVLLVSSLWYLPETIKNGTWFLEEFIDYQVRLFRTKDAGHGGFPGYHVVVLLLGCFPASIFALRGFKKDISGEQIFQQNFKKWMVILFWVVLVLFTIVQSKIVHYSSMAYFPITFLAALSIHAFLNKKIIYPRWMHRVIVVILLGYILVTTALPVLGMNADWLKDRIQDAFIKGNLDADVNWHFYTFLPSLVLIIGLGCYIYFFKKNQLSTALKSLFAMIPIFMLVSLIAFIGRIEHHVQGALVEFYEARQGEDCYVIAHHFKTYGRFFYTRKQPVTNEDSYDRVWLYYGDIDKDVYIVAKATKTQGLELPNIEELYRKNGFVFYKRPR